MQVTLSQIPMREILHFLGWHGTPVEPPLMEQIRRIRGEALEQVKPRAVMRRFVRLPDGTLEGTRFFPQGKDVREMLSACHETVLLAATLGADSERMLLRAQTKSAADALILDAVLSAAIEAVCDRMEETLREKLGSAGAVFDGSVQPWLRRHAACAIRANLRGAERRTLHRADGQPKRDFDAAKIGDGRAGDQPNAGFAKTEGLRGVFGRAKPAHLQDAKT